ncbi:unnamed protein product [Strongylus vulgaris]|uniref:Uncharacterized protein n=1 Tax=Strongylus vulgaris TaxID=40348 RepID=A0A3P7J4S2_STRVU|nr:unnamed protein product [Strongylus vulgaris]
MDFGPKGYKDVNDWQADCLMLCTNNARKSPQRRPSPFSTLQGASATTPPCRERSPGRMRNFHHRTWGVGFVVHPSVCLVDSHGILSPRLVGLFRLRLLHQ